MDDSTKLARERAAWRMRSWLASRPEHIQELARLFPPMTKIDATRWVLGYAEFTDGRVGLSLTTIPPEETFERYDEVVRTKEIVCPDCLSAVCVGHDG